MSDASRFLSLPAVELVGIDLPKNSGKRKREAQKLAVVELESILPGQIAAAGREEAAQCADGHESAREVWLLCEVQPHEAALRRYLAAQFRSLNDVHDDIVQESFVRLLRAYENGPIVSPRGLLFTVARNVGRDLLRRRGKATHFPITETPDLCVLPDEGVPAPPEAASRAQEYGLLAAAIAELPPRCREVLVLRKFEHLSQREIAQRLGISEHTVEAQLTKALHRCTTFFNRHGLP